MARAGVTTRPRLSPPPSSSAPPAKRRKLHRRRAAGTSSKEAERRQQQQQQQQEEEFPGLRMSVNLGGAAAADSSPSASAGEEFVDRLGSDASCCSSNGSGEGAVGFSDLQEDEDEKAGVEIESPMSSGEGERRERRSSRSTVIIHKPEEEISGELEPMERTELRKEEESSAAVNDSRRNSAVQNRERIRVTAAEVELFFSTVNGGNQELNRLNEKYNFDFANEKPLEGRYEWIPLKP